jgi:hypothetical protein
MNPTGDIIPTGIHCFNCGGPHHLRHCEIARDQTKINKACGEHPNGESQPTVFQKHRRPFTRPTKWRLPEDGKNDKRIIDGKPCTFNPTTKRWDPDAVPESGGIPLTTIVPPSTPPSLPPPTTPTLTLPTLPVEAGAFFSGYSNPNPPMNQDAKMKMMALQMIQLK